MDDRTKQIILGAIRHGLTSVGSLLAAKGYIGNGEVETGVGALIVVISIVWSAIEKHQRECAK